MLIKQCFFNIQMRLYAQIMHKIAYINKKIDYIVLFSAKNTYKALYEIKKQPMHKVHKLL